MQIDGASPHSPGAHSSRGAANVNARAGSGMLAGMALGRDAVLALLSLGMVAVAMRSQAASSSLEAEPAPPAPAAKDAPVLRSAALPAPRAPMRGTDFPDGVLALTWDDGPDAHTLELARFLHEQHVSGTFFVVGSWVEGLSEEPGYGKTKLATGYDFEPVLSELVALGHRVGNHSTNHMLLGHATADMVRDQFEPLPLPESRVRFFRAPGGWWTSETTAAFADVPELGDIVGPIHWDIDAKDWECSLYCRSDAPATECEKGPKPNEPRVRASVIAQRYVAKIERWKHGIVLMHDRVGDVGSTYARDVARALVPELIARGYVFAPPVLRFGPTTAPAPAGLDLARSPTHEGDINGDGRADRCTATPAGIECALGGRDGFKAGSIWASSSDPSFTLADANDDGRADLCTGTTCALAP